MLNFGQNLWKEETRRACSSGSKPNPRRYRGMKGNIVMKKLMFAAAAVVGLAGIASADVTSANVVG